MKVNTHIYKFHNYYLIETKSCHILCARFFSCLIKEITVVEDTFDIPIDRIKTEKSTNT